MSPTQLHPATPTLVAILPPENNAADRTPATLAMHNVLDSVVCELNEAFRAGTMDLHLTMGRVIINRLYGGDLSAWRAHGPKDLSFEALAARARHDLLVSASSLYRAVALFELTERIGVSRWKCLGVSHLRAVLGLADQEQRPLLAAAEKRHWTVERLEMEVRKLRDSSVRRRGRPALPAFLKTVNRVAKTLAQPTRSLAGLDRIDDFSHAEITRLHGLVVRAKEPLEMLEKRLASSLRDKNTTKVRGDAPERKRA